MTQPLLSQTQAKRILQLAMPYEMNFFDDSGHRIVSKQKVEGLVVVKKNVYNRAQERDEVPELGNVMNAGVCKGVLKPTGDGPWFYAFDQKMLEMIAGVNIDTAKKTAPPTERPGAAIKK